MQIGDGVYASSNTTPRSASASSVGVRTHRIAGEAGYVEAMLIGHQEENVRSRSHAGRSLPPCSGRVHPVAVRRHLPAGRRLRPRRCDGDTPKRSRTCRLNRYSSSCATAISVIDIVVSSSSIRARWSRVCRQNSRKLVPVSTVKSRLKYDGQRSASSLAAAKLMR